MPPMLAERLQRPVRRPRPGSGRRRRCGRRRCARRAARAAPPARRGTPRDAGPYVGPVLVARKRTAGQDLRAGAQPDDRDTRLRHRGAAARVLDDARGGADHARFRRSPSASSSCAASRAMHRVHALAVAQLADGRAGRRLDVDVRIAPRPAEALREHLPGRRLAGAHQPGDDDVLAMRAPSPQGQPPTLGGDVRPNPVSRSRRPRRSASSAAASSGGCSGWRRGAMGYRVAVLDPDPGLPGGGRRRPASSSAAYDDVDAALRLAERQRRRDLRARARRRGRRRGRRGAASRSGPGAGRCS